MCLKNNANQGTYFRLFMDVKEPPFLLRELAVTFPKDDYNPVLNINNPPIYYYDTLVEYLKARGQDLRTLSLQFNRPLKNVDLDKILVPIRKTLVSLSVCLIGDIAENEVEFENLQEMDNLESFEVKDSKKVEAKDVKRVREPPRQTILDQHERATVFQKLTSKISASFLTKLPPKVTSLSIGSLIQEQDFFGLLAGPELVSSKSLTYLRIESLTFRVPLQALATKTFETLTKFELFGPWLHPVQSLIPIIVGGMPELRTLALTNCVLMDSDITGLTPPAIKELRKCMTHLFPVHLPPPFAVGGNNFEQAMNAIVLPEAAQNRPLLSRLARKHMISTYRHIPSC
jgi:hypothetical protein